MCQERFDCFGAGCEAERRVPQFRQRFRGKPYQGLFIVYDEDASSMRLRRFGLRALPGLARDGDISRQWQIYREHASLTDGGRNVDGTAEPDYDAMHQRKAEAGPDADFLGGEERIEDLFEDLRRDTAA